MTESAARRPPLHFDDVVTVRAPVMAISGPDGQIRDGASGYYCSDQRLLDTLVLRINGVHATVTRLVQEQPWLARFTGTVHEFGVERARDARSRTESITVHNPTAVTRRATISVDAATDLADIAAARAGPPGPSLPPIRHPEGLGWRDAEGSTVLLTADPPPDARANGHAGSPATLRWTLPLGPGDHTTIILRLRADLVRRRSGDFHTSPREPAWHTPSVRCDDQRLERLVAQSLSELEALTVAHDGQPFLAAGAPWYLTLFGRDSLWAARMLLPLGTKLAEGTLRVLAGLQGDKWDPDTEEAPGKIIHEVRAVTSVLGSKVIPPRYYGTIDATPLFVTLLHDAWCWGLPAQVVEELLPAAERALDWMSSYGDGFIEYQGSLTSGLVNHGWKDSDNGVQFADGRPAEPPIALAEVQGYAYEAAQCGAALLSSFGGPAGKWLDWAARLRSRFHKRFWVRDSVGWYPATGLDATGQPVDGTASNMGHLLATGILDEEQAAAVAVRLTAPDMASGRGLRTLGEHNKGFQAVSYHAGSVWAHDTAIAVTGLAAAGHHAEAAGLLDELLSAAEHFGCRLPELWTVDRRADGGAVRAYPGACRPQAWAAASSIALLNATLGLRPDVPTGSLELTPMSAMPVGPITVEGLRVAGQPITVSVSEKGTGTVYSSNTICT